MAELADALDSGSSESDFIWVRVPSSAPKPKARGLSPRFWFFYILILEPLIFASANILLRPQTKAKLKRSRKRGS